MTFHTSLTSFTVEKMLASRRGQGIGLATVKAIVEGHGGKVTVKSGPGQGATFTVILPKIERLKKELWGHATWDGHSAPPASTGL
jgi:signal transduction histidine kinase